VVTRAPTKHGPLDSVLNNLHPASRTILCPIVQTSILIWGVPAEILSSFLVSPMHAPPILASFNWIYLIILMICANYEGPHYGTAFYYYIPLNTNSIPSMLFSKTLHLCSPFWISTRLHDNLQHRLWPKLKGYFNDTQKTFKILRGNNWRSWWTL
jgi:hypothetical protein